MEKKEIAKRMLMLDDPKIRKKIIKELSERLKNLVYMKSELYVEDVLSNLEKHPSFSLSTEDSLSIVYEVKFLINDIVGGIKRKASKRNKHARV